MPVGGKEKKGSDRGIDGEITFTDKDSRLETVLVSVKSGHVGPTMIRDLKGTVTREKAAMGVFITLDESTREMRLEADVAGLYHWNVSDRDYPKIQILTIRDLLELGKRPDLPPFRMHYPRPEHPELVAAEQRSIFGTTG